MWANQPNMSLFPLISKGWGGEGGGEDIFKSDYQNAKEDGSWIMGKWICVYGYL